MRLQTLLPATAAFDPSAREVKAGATKARAAERSAPHVFSGPGDVSVQTRPLARTTGRHLLSDRKATAKANAGGGPKNAKASEAETDPLEDPKVRGRLLAREKGQPNILLCAAPFKEGQQGATVRDALKTLCESIYPDRKFEDVKNYVLLGEKIVEAINASKDGRPPLSVTINDREITISSSDEALRAISWYLQAKSIFDNAGANRAITTPGLSGAMMISDPDRKLYHFLRSNKNSYPRRSSHLPNLLLGGKNKQNGIEDYRNELPGQRGTVLYDTVAKREGKDAQLYLKIEASGVPPLSGSGGTKRENALRFARHALSFIDMVLLKNKDVGNRSEKMSKGDIAAVHKKFIKAVDAMEWIGPETRAEIKRQVKERNASGLRDTLRGLINMAPRREGGREALKKVRDDLTKFFDELGADHGFDRLGNEAQLTIDQTKTIPKPVAAAALAPAAVG